MNPVVQISGLLLLLVGDILFVAGYPGNGDTASNWALIHLAASFCIALATRYLVRRQRYALAFPVLFASLVACLWALWLAGAQALGSSVEETVPDVMAVFVFWMSALAAITLGGGALVGVAKALPRSTAKE